MRIAAFTLLVLTLPACKSVDLPLPEGPDSSLLSVRVYISGANDGIVNAKLRRIYFAKLPEGSNDPLKAREYIKTGYTRGPRGYVCNIAPGRYAVACVVTLVEGKDQFIYLEDKVVRGSITDIGPGQVIDIGTVRGNRDMSWSRADATQNHFKQRILHQAKDANQLQKLFPKTRAMRGRYGKFERDGDNAALKSWVSGQGWTPGGGGGSGATGSDAPSSN